MSSFQFIFSRSTDDDAPLETPEHARPIWVGPPDDELGVCVPQALVLGRSPRAVVALRHLTAYSTGLSFEFLALARGLREREAQRLMHEQHMLDDEPSDSVLRFGIELGDGSRVSNLMDRRRLWGSPGPPEQPILMQHGGGSGSTGGGDITLRPGYWLWPLPPPGVIALYVEWPALGIELGRTELDAEPILAAAGESLRLWT